MFAIFVLLLVCVVSVSAFSPRFHHVKRTTAVSLGPPKLPTDENGKPKLVRSLDTHLLSFFAKNFAIFQTLGGVFQLITMGAGAPMLGEFKGMFFFIFHARFESKKGIKILRIFSTFYRG
jgi:hypothetical protein